MTTKLIIILGAALGLTLSSGAFADSVSGKTGTGAQYNVGLKQNGQIQINSEGGMTTPMRATASYVDHGNHFGGAATAQTIFVVKPTNSASTTNVVVPMKRVGNTNKYTGAMNISIGEQSNFNQPITGSSVAFEGNGHWDSNLSKNYPGPNNAQ